MKYIRECHDDRLATQGVGSTSEHDKKKHFSVRPQTDFIRLVSSKLMLQALEFRGHPVVRDGRFDRFFKQYAKKTNTLNPKERSKTKGYSKNEASVQTDASISAASVENQRRLLDAYAEALCALKRLSWKPNFKETLDYRRLSQFSRR